MRCVYSLIFLCGFFIYGQNVQDNFEGSGTITSWYGDNCEMNNSFTNPYQLGFNISNTVLEYNDIGGQYANVRFDVNTNFDLTMNNSFSLKIYVPSNGITGSQPNQISLKLQDNNLVEPWSTQSEIIKPLILDAWQEVTFNFENDTFINLDSGSLPPIQRTDFNRVVIQVNSENNNDNVLAYLDDVSHYNAVVNEPVYDLLVWADEFDIDGAINTSNWHHQTQLPNGGSWYNEEIQHYTDRVDNSFVSGGFLNVLAKEETYNNQGYTKQYTSARLNSKFAFTYGKVEIRAKLPSGIGTWPAIWMLGKNINEDGGYWDNEGFGSTDWPACGEIDIMEHWGDNQNFVQSAMHTPSSSGNTFNKGGQTIPTASNDFHIYTVIWSPEKMLFSVDDVIHYTYNPVVKNSNTWPFDVEQYLLLNVAILPNIETSFTESAMEIDYVRVYQENTLSSIEFVEKEKIKAYPNPVINELNIIVNDLESKKGTFEIFDIRGRVFVNKTFRINDKPLQYNTSSLNTGMYFIKFLFENGKINIFKFIKK